MKNGKIVLGNDAAPILYELETTTIANGRRRLTTGTLETNQIMPPSIGSAFVNLTSATLIEDDGTTRLIEFTSYNGKFVTFNALPPTSQAVGVKPPR